MTGAACAAGGCASGRLFDCTNGSPMHGFAAPKIPQIRLGVVGMGSRGCGVVGRVCNLPGVTVVAVCDNVPEKIDKAQKILSDRKKPKAKEYLGDEAWKALVNDPNIDVVYNTTPWALRGADRDQREDAPPLYAAGAPLLRRDRDADR